MKITRAEIQEGLAGGEGLLRPSAVMQQIGIIMGCKDTAQTLAAKPTKEQRP